jgi:hypothetical protein
VIAMPLPAALAHAGALRQGGMLLMLLLGAGRCLPGGRAAAALQLLQARCA